MASAKDALKQLTKATDTRVGDWKNVWDCGMEFYFTHKKTGQEAKVVIPENKTAYLVFLGAGEIEVKHASKV